MIEFDSSDLDRLVRDLGKAGERAVAGTKVVIAKTGHDVVADAQQGAPVDTGNLKNSIAVDIDPDGLGFEAGSHALYAGYVEYGTTRMAPQPYLMPAFDRRLPFAFSAFEQVAAGMLRP